MSDLYERVSVTPQQLIVALQECAARWPDARLHKNDVTRNLSVEVDDEYVGEVDLLDATVHDFNDPGDDTAFIAAATDTG
jgi:hypothetical protein